MIDKAKFTYSPAETKKQANALKSLNLSYKIRKLNRVKITFPQNQMNDLILDRLKEIRQLQNDIKLNELDDKVKSDKRVKKRKIK